MHARFRTPVNALITGALITVLFVLLVFYQPEHNVRSRLHHLPGEHRTRSYSLVSFGVSGIYLSFLLAVIAAIVARTPRLGARGRVQARDAGPGR